MKLKIFLKFSVILSFLICLNNSYASGYLTGLAEPEATIEQVFTHSGGGVTLFVSGVSLNPDQCGNTTKVHLKGDLAGHQHMVSAALTAFAAGKKVGLHSSGCETIPFWGGSVTRPIINNLWISN